MPLCTGDFAPDFALAHRVGEDPVRLSERTARGPVVILFFPLAFSEVCTREICGVAANLHAWTELGAEILGVSVDSPFVNARFAEACGASFPILSDFNREASEAYGVLNEDFFGMRGVANRSVFVVDRGGRIAYAWVSEDPSVLPDLDAVRDRVRALGG